MPKIHLSMGSNIDRETHISSALRELGELFGELAISSVYETLAVGFEGPPFFNLVVSFQSDEPLLELAKALRE
ncbi:MAG: 2-amino-4-hydroxy-6-hydroxymethyldihydropteridine diphosphokinase, partial [Methylococcales bacterium]